MFKIVIDFIQYNNERNGECLCATQCNMKLKNVIPVYGSETGNFKYCKEAFSLPIFYRICHQRYFDENAHKT